MTHQLTAHENGNFYVDDFGVDSDSNLFVSTNGIATTDAKGRISTCMS
jgi:hypothetical protein